MAREPLHLHPEKDRSLARAKPRDRFLPGLINRPDVAPVDMPPVVRLEDIDGQRIDHSGRTTDAVTVVLDEEENG